jgi:hypothetical protein
VRPSYPAPPHLRRPPPLRVPGPPRTAQLRSVARILDEGERTLLDVVDSLLNRGVLVNGEVVLALAGVDLVYLRLSVLLCAADRLFGPPRKA